jgi:hypothetical protein
MRRCRKPIGGSIITGVPTSWRVRGGIPRSFLAFTAVVTDLTDGTAEAL